MTKHICYCLATLLALFACENAPTSTVTTSLTPQYSSAVVSGAELLEALEGFWQSERDPAFLLEIRDEKMKRIHGNQASEEYVLEAFSDCDAAACKADDGASTGWCFTEKGTAGLQCNRVLRCDSLLQFKTTGGTDIFKFKKVKP
jgi:hypothetical protein